MTQRKEEKPLEIFFSMTRESGMQINVSRDAKAKGISKVEESTRPFIRKKVPTIIRTSRINISFAFIVLAIGGFNF